MSIEITVIAFMCLPLSISSALILITFSIEILLMALSHPLTVEVLSTRTLSVRTSPQNALLDQMTAISRSSALLPSV